MSDQPLPARPVLARHARYRWDELRKQHQLVFSESLLVLNEWGAAIIKLCNGQSVDEIVQALQAQFPGSEPAADVAAFLQRLDEKGLLREAPAP